MNQTGLTQTRLISNIPVSVPIDPVFIAMLHKASNFSLIMFNLKKKCFSDIPYSITSTLTNLISNTHSRFSLCKLRERFTSKCLVNTKLTKLKLTAFTGYTKAAIRLHKLASTTVVVNYLLRSQSVQLFYVFVLY